MAFFRIGQKPVLVWYDFLAVFDFKNLTGYIVGISHNHIEFANGELKARNRFPGICFFRFQQNYIFHHPAADFI
jgi:hypothetical protein